LQLKKIYNLNSTIAYTCLLGLFLPLILLHFSKGYLVANRYLASFFFFASLYFLENFYFFYGESLYKVAFFTNVHAFFYLMSPFAFFYVRSILRDNSTLSKRDYLHFVPFVLSFIGYIPYFFTSWDHKLIVAQNTLSENWDLSQFHLNIIFPHKIDQILTVLNTYIYSISLWYLFWYYKKIANKSLVYTEPYKVIRNWLVIFTGIITIITINFTVTMANLWIYDDKSIFLEKASVALLFASVVYVGMNMIVMFFPHIMYGFPVSLKVTPLREKASIPKTQPNFFKESYSQDQKLKNELQLFTPEYRNTIETALENCIDRKVFLEANCKLIHVAKESGILSHHLTYFFNDIQKVSFSDWRNNLRVEHAKALFLQGKADKITLHTISLNCGFASQNTFIRAFKKATGTTPSNYLKSLS
jgi:AraC-like DNA-binding protein